MPPKVNAGEHAEQFERIDTAHQADIEEPVVNLRAWSDLHPTAVNRGVGECREGGGLVAARGPSLLPRRIFLVSIGQRDFYPKWRKPKHSRSQTQCIAAMSSQPSRQTIRPPRDFAIQTNASHAAEIASVWCGIAARVLIERC